MDYIILFVILYWLGVVLSSLVIKWTNNRTIRRENCPYWLSLIPVYNWVLPFVFIIAAIDFYANKFSKKK